MQAFCKNQANCPRLQVGDISIEVRRNLLVLTPQGSNAKNHDDVMTWKHLLHYWAFVQGFQLSPIGHQWIPFKKGR